MTNDQKEKCQYIIHSAAAGAAAIGFIPIPGADIGPISAIQVTMIIGLARVFNVSITKNLAIESSKTFLVGQTGKLLAAQFAKLIPVIGGGVNATVAAGLTETLVWETAESFAAQVATVNE